MNIKDFKKGQTAYILNMHRGRNTKPTTHEATVSCVGKKYVTLVGDRKYESSDDEYSLTEHTNGGDRTLLCPDMESARMYIEREELRVWLYNAPQLNWKYTLEQLREVKEILEERRNQK